MSAPLDLAKKKFNRWRVLHRLENLPSGKTVWLCRCKCGTERSVVGGSLLKGVSRSCGCYNHEQKRARQGSSNPMFRHGQSRTRTYQCWVSMRARCTSKSRSDYDRYGGRGIRVCKRWQKFENFFADMGECPVGMSLGRKDNDKGYTPTNCRWETPKQQNRNRSGYNRLVEYQGEKKTIPEWADITGLTSATIRGRLKAGWSVKEAMTVPRRPRNGT